MAANAPIKLKLAALIFSVLGFLYNLNLGTSSVACIVCWSHLVALSRRQLGYKDFPGNYCVVPRVSAASDKSIDAACVVDTRHLKQVEWIRSSMDNWTRTKSRVWYGQHVLVLGWSEKTLYLLQELFEALHTSGQQKSVVVMADRDQAEMHQEIQHYFLQLWEHMSFFDRRSGFGNL